MITFDANILIHAMDRMAGERHRLATELVDYAVGRNVCLTLQALSEFYAATTRMNLIEAEQASAMVADWMVLFPVVVATPSAIKLAMHEAANGRYSFWDAMLLAAAGDAGCSLLLSEDMADGARLGPVTIRNPFLLSIDDAVSLIDSAA